jgi:hypothetical protein
VVHKTIVHAKYLSFSLKWILENYIYILVLLHDAKTIYALRKTREILPPNYNLYKLV